MLTFELGGSYFLKAKAFGTPIQTLKHMLPYYIEIISVFKVLIINRLNTKLTLNTSGFYKTVCKI